LKWTIDGATTFSITQAVPTTYKFLIINTALGGAAGTVNGSTLPQTFSVDYVRAWLADAIPPTAPANLTAAGGLTSATLTWTAAADNVGVARYNVYRSTVIGFTPAGGNLIGTTTATSYADSAPAGTYYYVVTAQDAAGNVGPASNEAGATITGDTVPPTVAITAPANNTNVTGSVAVTANATDNVGVTGVQFVLDGANLGAEDTAAPYSAPWNTAAAANGSHTLTAVARDAAGNTTTASAVTVTVNNVPDTTPPAVSITSPAGGATVSGSIAVSASASDDGGVAGVQFLIDGANLGAEDTTAPYSVSWGTTTAANGSHTLTARARDAAGNTTASAAVTVSVSNTTTTGLVAAYGFDEGTGTTAGDSTASGLNGTLNGAAWVTTGKYGKALSFNGTSSLVTVADAGPLHLSAAMTLEAWVYPTTASTNFATAVLKERGTTGLAYSLYVTDGANRPPSGYINVGGVDRNATGTMVLPLNTWTHLAVTYNGSTFRLYVNGVQVASKSQTGTIASSTSPLRIGGNSVWGEYFNGLIDELRVYNTALTQAQIQSDMNTPVGGGGGAQLADRPAASPSPGTPALPEEQLPTLLAAAVARWNAAGVPAALLPEPAAVPVHIADLPGSGLGFTNVATREIWIDRDAAGYGWSTAAVPVELPELGARVSAERFDLETVLAHEVGHLLGIADLTPSPDRPADLMDQTLAPGEVRLPSALDVRLAARAAGFNGPAAPSGSIASVPPQVSLDGIAVPLPGTFGWDGTVTGASSWALFDQRPFQWEERPVALPTSADLASRSIDPNGGVPLTVGVPAAGDEVRPAPSTLAEDMSPRPPSP
jgi:fibronectin type 3 domain-containing protein